MREIEAKLLEVDPDAVEERLRAVGADQVFDGTVRTAYYDFPDGRIEAQGSLRVREMGDQAFITYKQDLSRDGAKEMEETEFDVGSYETASRFLELLGLERQHESSKYRSKWERGDLEYVIDDHGDIPPLLEIEAPDRERLEDAVTELGYDPAETVTWDTAELKQEYGVDER